MNRITIAVALAFFALNAARADDMIITWGGGGSLVYADGRIIDVQEGPDSGTVYFQTNYPPQHVNSERVFSDGMEAKQWEWWVFERPGPGHGSGMCTMTRDKTTIFLDC